jgi:hypothetical protein
MKLGEKIHRAESLFNLAEKNLLHESIPEITYAT